MVNKYLVGILTVVLLMASVYVMLPGSVRIDVGKTYTTFQVWEDESWVLAGTERTILMDGTKKMRASSRSIITYNEGNITKIIRIALFKDNISARDTYTFDGSVTDITLIPVSHEVEILNGEGKIFLYEVKDLHYTGETKKGITSPQLFGHQMKVEWDPGNYYSKIYKYLMKDEGKLSVRYRVNSDKFTTNVRLFDPPIEDNDLTVANGE